MHPIIQRSITAHSGSYKGAGSWAGVGVVVRLVKFAPEKLDVGSIWKAISSV